MCSEKWAYHELLWLVCTTTRGHKKYECLLRMQRKLGAKVLTHTGLSAENTLRSFPPSLTDRLQKLGVRALR